MRFWGGLEDWPPGLNLDACALVERSGMLVSLFHHFMLIHRQQLAVLYCDAPINDDCIDLCASSGVDQR